MGERLWPRLSELDVNQVGIVVGQFNGEIGLYAVKHLYFRAMLLVIPDEAMVQGSLGALGTGASALARESLVGRADMVAVVVVAIKRGGLIAGHEAFLQELLDGDGIFIAVHVASHKHGAVVLGLQYLGLGQHEPHLGGASLCAARLTPIAHPPQVGVEHGKGLARSLVLEYGRLE